MDKYRDLQKKAMTIRELTMKTIGHRGFGHIGGSLDLAEVMSVLYFDAMRVDPKNPDWEDRDRFVLSKGHGGPAVYATLALKGYFPESELMTLNQPGTHLPSHCDRKLTTGIDMSTGSLGQGFSAAVGMALAAKMDRRDIRVYSIIGDGESQEGQIWEAALLGASRKLDNLIAFTDYNKMQIDGTIEEINGLYPLDEKWKSFNWHVQVVDGHDCRAISLAIDNAKKIQGRPHMIILNTIKGKGASHWENKVSCHNDNNITEELTRQALEEMKEAEKDV
ncbi:MAG: transketolase [Lachnospiraceae bacterium]|nr:transketolase [Lachnospiraceae bacterium]